MSQQQQNIETVRSAYQAFQRGDIAGVLSTLTGDVIWETQGPEQIPYAGIFKGKDGVAEFFRILAETEVPEVFEPRRFFAEGDMVVVLGRYAARIKSNNVRAETDWVHTFLFRGGKVAEYREYLDSAKYAQAYAVSA